MKNEENKKEELKDFVTAYDLIIVNRNVFNKIAKCTEKTK